jgi:hypothetical protein
MVSCIISFNICAPVLCIATKPDTDSNIDFESMISSPSSSTDMFNNVDVKANSNGTTPTESSVDDVYVQKFESDFNNASFKNVPLELNSEQPNNQKLYKYFFPELDDSEGIEHGGILCKISGANNDSFTTNVKNFGEVKEAHFNVPSNIRVLLLRDGKTINNSGMATKRGKYTIKLIRTINLKEVKKINGNFVYVENDEGKTIILEVYQTAVINFEITGSSFNTTFETLIGFLKDIFDRFLMPFFSIFMRGFNLLFQEVLVPLLAKLFQVIWEIQVLIFKFWYNWFLYVILKLLLRVLDWLQVIVNVLAGVEKVSINGGPNQNIINLFLTYGGLKKWFWQITVIGVIITFVFTFYVVVKNTISLGQQQKPMGHVLGSALKSMLSFIMIPFMVLVLSNLSSVVLGQIVKITSKGNNVSIGGYIYVTTALANTDFGVKNNYDVDNLIDKYGDIRPIYDNHRLISDCGDLNYNYVLAIILTIYALYVFIALSLSFVIRIIEIVMLYLISPLIAASIPLDEGAKFGQWREFFIVRFITGYAVLVGMNIFFLFIPWIWSGNVIFDDHSSILNIVAKMIIFFGGLHAASRMDSIIIPIINYQAGSGASESMEFLGGLMRQGAATGIQSLTGVNVAPLLSTGIGKKPEVPKPDPRSQQRFK